MLTSFRQTAKIHILVLPDSLDRGKFLKKTFGYLKEAVGRYCGRRQAQDRVSSMPLVHGLGHCIRRCRREPAPPFSFACRVRARLRATRPRSAVAKHIGVGLEMAPLLSAERPLWGRPCRNLDDANANAGARTRDRLQLQLFHYAAHGDRQEEQL